MEEAQEILNIIRLHWIFFGASYQTTNTWVIFINFDFHIWSFILFTISHSIHTGNSWTRILCHVSAINIYWYGLKYVLFSLVSAFRSGKLMHTHSFPLRLVQFQTVSLLSGNIYHCQNLTRLYLVVSERYVWLILVYGIYFPAKFEVEKSQKKQLKVELHSIF